MLFIAINGPHWADFNQIMQTLIQKEEGFAVYKRIYLFFFVFPVAIYKFELWLISDVTSKIYQCT